MHTVPCREVCRNNRLYSLHHLSEWEDWTRWFYLERFMRKKNELRSRAVLL